MTSPKPGLVAGFAGLGKMGAPMVRHLNGACDSLKVHDLNQQVTQNIATELNATACNSADSLGDSCDVLITMLPDADSVAAVILGSEHTRGAIESLASGSVVIDMSSSDPVATRALGETLHDKGIILLDAPVSGGVRKAVSGELSIMLGGNDIRARDRAASLLSCMGQVFDTGTLGSGHAMKALNNYVSAAGLVAACEAVLIAQSFDLDAGTLIDVVNASTGRNNSTENKIKPFVLDNNFEAAGFALALMHKDIDTAARLAQQLALDLPGIQQARTLWQQAHQSLAEGADHTEIFSYLSQLSGSTTPDDRS